MEESQRELNSDELTYPCILKPVESHRCFSVYGKKLLIARGGPELERAFKDARRRGFEMMVTEVCTMCGHGMIAFRLVEKTFNEVKRGVLSIEEAVEKLDRLCTLWAHSLQNLLRQRPIIAGGTI